MTQTAVLGYSGGLDTSVAIPWLKENHDVDVVCVLVDVGQPLPDLEDAIARGKRNGARDVLVVDAKAEFARDFVAPALKANALYEGVYPLATALARPLIAAKLVDVAHDVGAAFVAHGCTGKGNDQVRFEVAIRALDPALKVIAPLREWTFDAPHGPSGPGAPRSGKMTRDGEIRYARERNLALPEVVDKRTFSTDENLWGRSVEAGVLEDPAQAAVEDAFAWTTAPEEAPDAPERVTIGFEAGVPVTVDGKRLDLVELIQHVHRVAGAHGVGRIDHVENRLVGIKSREVYEAPAAVALITAHKALEALTLTRDVTHYKAQLEDKLATLAYDGLWFSPLREAVSAFVDHVQADVTGEVTLKFFKGHVTVAGRSAAGSLYDTALATYDEGDAFDHDSAKGFIDIWGLPLANRASVKKKR